MTTPENVAAVYLDAARHSEWPRRKVAEAFGLTLNGAGSAIWRARESGHIPKGARRAPIVGRCGTYAGAMLHRERREPLCAACLAAAAAYMRAYRARRKVAS